MKIYTSLDQLVGHTPLLELKRYGAQKNLNATIIAKLESFNPAGSSKDRIALEMIRDAEGRGVLSPDSVIIEPTSGNTGIGLAAIASSKGYRVMIVMPDNMSAERQSLMKAYGAELVLTDGALGMTGAIKKAEELASELPRAFIAGQFENPANPQAHFNSTGPEIWDDTDGELDIFIAGVGTGGTVSGTGKYLKSKDPRIKVVAVEPADSPILSEGKSGPHGLQGIGAGFVPMALDTEIYDEVVTVTTEEAYAEARDLAKSEGVLVGISSGAVLSAAHRIAERQDSRGKRIVVLLPDSGERYLSTQLFSK